MTHILPDLPYHYEQLEPYIDATTMEIHHTKHHQAYINNLNKALEAHPDLQDKSLEQLITNLNDIPEDIRTVVRNNAGGHYNHSMFWRLMDPAGGGEPKDKIKAAIDTTFGSFENFKADFTKNALSRFGSGWVWLVLNNEKKLIVYSTPNQDNPLMDGNIPLLGLDVWEHAYYLKYQNKRNEYIDNWWFIVNWKEVENLYNTDIN